MQSPSPCSLDYETAMRGESMFGLFRRRLGSLCLWFLLLIQTVMKLIETLLKPLHALVGDMNARSSFERLNDAQRLDIYLRGSFGGLRGDSPYGPRWLHLFGQGVRHASEPEHVADIQELSCPRARQRTALISWSPLMHLPGSCC